jgi:hypothetical protein
MRHLGHHPVDLSSNAVLLLHSTVVNICSSTSTGVVQGGTGSHDMEKQRRIKNDVDVDSTSG